MKNLKKLKVWHVAIAILVIYVAVDYSRQPPATPTRHVVSCTDVDAYAQANMLVRLKKGEQRFADMDDAQIEHDPATDRYEVRSYYTTASHNKVQFHANMRCRDSEWFMTSYTIDGVEYDDLGPMTGVQ